MGPIKVRYGEAAIIQRMVGCSYPTALKALKGETKSDLAKQIRALAVKRAKAYKQPKEILMRTGEVGKLAESVGATYDTVIDALKGRRSSHLALQIRALALQRGGVEVEFK